AAHERHAGLSLVGSCDRGEAAPQALWEALNLDPDQLGQPMTDPSRSQTISLTPEALYDYPSIDEVSLLPHGKHGHHLMRIDPRRHEIILTSPADDTHGKSKELQNVSVDLDETGDIPRYVLTVSTEDAPAAAYALAYAVVRQTDTGDS